MAAEGDAHFAEGVGYVAEGGDEVGEEVIDASYIEALAAEASERHAAAGGEGAGHGGAGTGEDDMDDGGAAAAPRPDFAPLSHAEASGGMVEYRKIRVPPHRMTPLRENWEQIAGSIVEHMKLYIRMNTKSRCIELKTSEHTEEPGAIQKAEDFCKAFVMGFDVADALALLRLDDIYVGEFPVAGACPKPTLTLPFDLVVEQINSK